MIFKQVLGFADMKLSTTFTFNLVDYHCSFAFPIPDAGTVNFVRIPRVARLGGSNLIEDAFHHFLMDVREWRFLQICMTFVDHPHMQPFQFVLISKF